MVRLRDVLVAMLTVLLVLLAALPRPRADGPSCSCERATDRGTVLAVVRQPLSPVSPAPDDSALALFEETSERLAAILARFRPETWGHGRVDLVLLRPEDPEPLARVDVDLRPALGRVEGAALTAVHVCPRPCAGLGRRIVFEVRDASRDLRGVLDRLSFELCAVPTTDPGWARLEVEERYHPGRRFPSGPFGMRRRHVEAFLAAQVRPLVQALRGEYRAVREEHRMRARDLSVRGVAGAEAPGEL